jgi:hypothetical protein
MITEQTNTASKSEDTSVQYAQIPVFGKIGKVFINAAPDASGRNAQAFAPVQAGSASATSPTATGSNTGGGGGGGGSSTVNVYPPPILQDLLDLLLPKGSNRGDLLYWDPQAGEDGAWVVLDTSGANQGTLLVWGEDTWQILNAPQNGDLHVLSVQDGYISWTPTEDCDEENA